MVPFQTDAAMTPSLSNKNGYSDKLSLYLRPAISFYLTRNRRLSKLSRLERSIVPDASGNVRQASLPEQAGAAERSPRRLSTHQKAVLIQVLLAFPNETVSLRYLPSASDALIYAEDFST